MGAGLSQQIPREQAQARELHRSRPEPIFSVGLKLATSTRAGPIKQPPWKQDQMTPSIADQPLGTLSKNKSIREYFRIKVLERAGI